MPRIIFFDTETTGNDPATARLIQLAYKELHAGDITCHHVCPPCEITIGAMATHHITNQQAAAWPQMTDALRAKITRDFDGAIMVAHNAPFDVSIMQNEGVTLGRCIDTLKVARHLFDLESYSLQFLRYTFGIYENYVPSSTGVAVAPHDARADVFILEKLFQKLRDVDHSVWDAFPSPVEWMIHVSQQPTKLWRWPRFGKHASTPFSEIPRDYLQWALGQSFDADLLHAVRTELCVTN